MAKTAEIRASFLNYFTEHGHTVLPSSSLIPFGDASLLFTNAGMVQFKDVFLGHEHRPYGRAATAQRCVRAGGKHNDLENVGYTARHHTFFEMLGNFSFGDYFKREAIQLAWNYLTQILKIPAEKLWVTVFEEDDEAADIWLNEIKVDPARFSRCGEKDNFWAMGDTGPCGPCSEIFYDHGPEIPGGPPGSPDADADRYIEIWNLVFMQYNRDASGKMTRLPKPSVDTGMGLERIAAVLQGVHTNYEIDLFQNIISAIKALIPGRVTHDNSLKVIADHIRSTSFLIADGVIPSNEGRGYVLRRIIRRAIRHGHQLGLNNPFFYQLVKVLALEMGEAYPELIKQQEYIETTIRREEELFSQTLEQGMKLFSQAVSELSGSVIPGQVVFKLYDTYGFPADLTADIAREKGLSIDEEGFHQEMELQRRRSQAASQFTSHDRTKLDLTNQITTFIGYEHLKANAKIEAIFVDEQSVSELDAEQNAVIVLQESPFYAEAGGQIGDQGLLKAEDAIFEVLDTQKVQNSILHYGRLLKGHLKLKQTVHAEVDSDKRKKIAAHHSATHLLHAALRKLLGEHVQQRGSLVEAERLRFDFSHFEALTEKQIKAIEACVNEAIRANYIVQTKLMTPEEAMDSGAVALFGEKYGAEVRVLAMGNFSMELCGGTHVQQTGEIGLFKIISESAVGAGIRRIEAVAGSAALNFIRQQEIQLIKLAQMFKTDWLQVVEKAQQFVLSQKNLEKEYEKLQKRLVQQQSQQLLEKVISVASISLLAQQVEVYSVQQLREMIDYAKAKLTSAVVVLAAIIEHKVVVIAGVSKELSSKIHAGQLIQYLAEQLGGKGGGRPDMAQGGGERLEALPQVLLSIESWIKGKI